MAAGSFEIVKQGDVYRILYSASSFGSGRTVTAVPYNPSGAAQTAISLTEISTTGIYTADFDTTGKTLGSWMFVIKQLSVTQAYMRIQVVDPSTLNDTIWEDIKSKVDTAVTELQSATTGLAKIETDVQATKTEVDAVKSDVESGTTGLGAIKSAVDAIATAVSHIQNNTLNTLAMPTSVIIPTTGTTTRRIFMNIFNEGGTMEDPDSNQIRAQIYLPDGTDVTDTYLSGVEPIYMTRDGLGQYHTDFVVNNASSETALTFKFTYVEGGDTIVRDGIVQLVSSGSDYSALLGQIDTNVSDVKDVVDGIDTKVDAVGTTVDGIDGKVDTINSNVSSAKSTVETVNSKVDTLTTNVGNVDSSLTSAKGTGFNTATDSLNAIRTAIDGYLANGGSIDTVLDGIVTNQDAIKGVDFNGTLDSLKAISDRIYNGGIAM